MKKKYVLITVTAMLIGLLCCGLVWSGGVKGKKDAPQEKAVAVPKGKYNEAPMLRELVAQGKLPPVDKRLPPEPLAIKPYEEVGQYGGTLHNFSTQANHPGDGAYAGGGFETVLRLSRDLKKIIPNIASGYESSSDAKVLTLYLRKGMKWSDGEPFTAEDVIYWWEDEVLNDDLTPAKPKYWSPGGELMKVRRVDDYTVQFLFAAPYPVAAMLLTGPEGRQIWMSPEHYLKQFHITYNEKANELAKQNGFEFWYQYYNDRKSHWSSMSTAVGLPTLHAFFLKEKTSDSLFYERNPYYWKVDTAGNQLPYMDNIITMKVEDPEIYNAKIVSGETDFAARYTSVENYPLYKESAKKAGYRVLLWPSGYGCAYIYQLNQTCKDAVLRDLFRDVRFRRAMSLALNRKEMNETIFFGLGVPRQWTLIESSMLFEPRFGEAYANYDPDGANKLLDEMGLKWDSAHKYRLRPDGKRLAVTLDLVPSGPQMAGSVPVSELAKEYWAKIGIQLTIRSMTGELAATRGPANEIIMNAWMGDRGTDMAFFTGDVRWFMPQTFGWEGSYGIEWARWYSSNGQTGEEPPAEVKQLYVWLKEMLATVDENRRNELGKKILESQAKNVWVIGTVGMVPQCVIVKNELRNVPEKHVYTWDYLYTNHTASEQYFLKK